MATLNPFGTYKPPVFNPAPNPFANLDFSSVDFGPLGAGYTGPARTPNSPNPTGRFDHKTVGAGLAFSQLSNAEAAKAFQEGVRLFNMPRFQGMSVDPRRPERSGLANAAFGTLSPAFQNLNIQQEGFQKFIQDPTPQQIQAARNSNQGQYYDPVTRRLYVESGGGAENTYITEAMELTGMTLDQLAQLGPSESAQLFDAVIRAREFKNQLPKRTGLLGAALPALTGLAFGPMAGGIVGGAFNAAKGNYLTAAGALLGGALFQKNPAGQSLFNQSKVGQKIGSLFRPSGVPTGIPGNPNAVPGASGIRSAAGMAGLAGTPSGVAVGGAPVLGGAASLGAGVSANAVPGAAAGAKSAVGMAGLAGAQSGAGVLGAIGGKSMGLLGSTLAAVGGDILGGLATNFLGDVLGNNDISKAVKALDAGKTLPDFTAGGISTTRAGNRVTVTPSAQRGATVRAISDVLGAGAGAVGDQLAQVRPGFGRLTDARVEALRSARERTIGDLKDNIARRRLSGSSFASDTIARAEAEFAMKESEVRARSFLEELDMSNKLIEQQTQYRTQQYETFLTELNLEGNVGLQLATQGIGSMANLAKAQSEILVSAAEARGMMLDRPLQKIGDSLSSAISTGIGNLLRA